MYSYKLVVNYNKGNNKTRYSRASHFRYLIFEKAFSSDEIKFMF
jgi:hypothetical protein